MSTATHKHRAAFTLSLRTISPALSALHASRLRLLPSEERNRGLGAGPPLQAPPLTTLTCVRCGHASVCVRFVRSRTRKEKQTQNLRKRVDKNKEQGKGKDKATNEDSAKKDTMPARVLERTCATCDFVEVTPVPRGAAALFQSSRSSARKARQVAKSRADDTIKAMLRVEDGRLGHDPSGSTRSSAAFSDSPRTTPGPPIILANAAPARPAALPSQPPVPDPASRKKPKRKPGLQELLARNRQRQDAAARENASGGLSSFLDGL